MRVVGWRGWTRGELNKILAGVRSVGQALAFAFIPFALFFRARARDGEPRIVVIRTVFVAFIGALLLFAVVLMFMHPLVSRQPVPVVVYALLAVGAVSLSFIPWMKRRLLNCCGPPDELAQTYASTFFLGIAFAESPALLAFVATFLAEALWPYLVGMAVSFVGFGTLAPTATRIGRLDDSLSARGCPHSLRAGLFSAGDDTRSQ